MRFILTSELNWHIPIPVSRKKSALAVCFERLVVGLEPERKTDVPDLYTFAHDDLGYNLLNEHDHGYLSRVVQDETHDRLLILWPRETYKTTLCTVSYALWEAVRNPNVAILIASNTISRSAEMLGEIMGHVQYNERFRTKYGDLYQGDRKARAKWSGTEATVRTRNRQVRHATWTAAGAETNLVSSHYDIVIVDDLVTRNDRESAAGRKRNKRWLQAMIPMVKTSGRLIIIGTRWHHRDAYDWLLNDLNPSLSGSDKYKVELSDCYDAHGESAFPRIFSTAELKRKETEMETELFSATMRNKPITSGQVFIDEDDIQPHLFDYSTLDLKKLAIIGACDPSLGDTDEGDPSAVVQVGIDQDRTLFVLRADIRQRPIDTTDELIQAWHKDHRFVRFGYESVQFQALQATRLFEKAKSRGIMLPVVEVGQHIRKDIRIRAMQPMLKNGSIRFRRDWQQAYPELMQQLFLFPQDHDDGPDALEMCTRIAENVAPMPDEKRLAATQRNMETAGAY